MTQVIKVAKQGYNVLTETNPNNLIFDSRLNTFKIIKQGVVSILVDADPKRVTIAHEQSSIPAYLVFLEFSEGRAALPFETDASFTGTGARYSTTSIDGTNIYVDFYKGATANYWAQVSYFIFETPGT